MGTVTERLDLLESRVGAIEQRLGVAEAAGGSVVTAPPAPPSVTPPESAATAPPAAASTATPEAVPGASASPPPGPAPADIIARLNRLSRAKTASGAAHPLADSPSTPPRPSGTVGSTRVPPPLPPAAVGKHSEAAPARSTEPDRPDFSVEQFLGARVFMVLGALLVFGGGAFGLKLAWDAGWFGLLPDWAKSAAAALCGGALLAAGEFVRRRLGGLAAAGLTAAGIGTLYATAWWSWVHLELYGAAAAFALLALTSGLAFVLALRGRSALMGVLAVLLGNAVPLLFFEESGPVFVAPVYLLCVFAAGLAMRRWSPRFAAVREAAWWGVAVVGGIWVLGNAFDPAAHWVGVVFVAGVWGLLLAEMTSTAQAATEQREPIALEAAARWFLGRSPRTAVVATGWASAAGMLSADAIGMELWLVSGALASGCAVLALVLAGHLFIGEDRPRDEREALGVVCAVMSGGLLLASVALAFSGWTESIVWIVLATAAVVGGTWARVRYLHVYGLALLVLVSVRLVTVDLFFGVGGLPVWVGLGLGWGWWTALCFGIAAAWFATFWLTTRYNGWRGRGAPLAVAGCVFVAIGPSVHADDTVAVLAWLTGVAAAAWAAAVCIGRGPGVLPRLRRGFAGAPGVAAALVLACVAAFGIIKRIDGWNVMIEGPAPLDDTAALLLVNGALLVIAAAVISRVLGESAKIARLLSTGALSGSGAMCLALAYPSAVGSTTPELVWWGAAGLFVGFAGAWGRSLALWSASVFMLGMVSLLWARWEFAEGPGVWVTGGCAVAVLGWGALAWTAKDCTRELTAVDDPMLVGKVPLVFMVVCLLASAAGWAGSAAIGPDVGGAFVSAALSVCGAALIAAPVLARHAWARRMGLGFVAAAAAKVVIFDLAGVSAGWRTASVVLVGLVMLGVAVWYARVERKAREPKR